MLIPSPRHTAEDLALWAELEAADHAARVPELLAAQSLAAMREWLKNPADKVACTSWGKDSVLLLSLLCSLDADIPVVWVRMRGRDNPDCELVRDAFLSRWPLSYCERTFVYEDCAHDEHWAAIAAEFGPKRMTGIRMDESMNRKISVFARGLDTGTSFRPLAHWRLRHVYAYAAQYELPLHPAYACLGGGRWPREYVRVHGIGGKSGTGMGRREWEAEYYPDVLRTVAK